MSRPVPRPTRSELAILRTLWTSGPATVRDVHGTLSRERDLGYTTVLKLMQIMTEKGILLRESRGRAHVYRAVQSESHTQRRLVGDLIDRAFGGSARKLIVAALSSKRASPAELEEIRRLLDEMKQQRGDS